MKQFKTRQQYKEKEKEETKNIKPKLLMGKGVMGGGGGGGVREYNA